MILELRDFTEWVGIERHQVLEGAEVGVVAPVLVDGEDFALFFRESDEGVGLGGGDCEGLFDDYWRFGVSG